MASAVTGMIYAAALFRPTVGSSLRFIPNSYSSSTLEIKLGIAMPQVANTMMRLSSHLPRL